MAKSVRLSDGTVPDTWRLGDGSYPTKVMLGDGTQIWPPPPPTLTLVSPSSASTAGGTTLTLTGTSFIGVTTVTIGGSPATSVVTVNETTVTCVAPAKTAGVSQVTITTAQGVSNSISLTYSSLVDLYEPFDYPDGTMLVDKGWIGVVPDRPWGVEVVGGVARAIGPPSGSANGTQGNGMRVHPTKAMTNDFIVSMDTGPMVTGYFNGMYVRSNANLDSAVVLLNNGASSGFYTVSGGTFTSRFSASTPTSVSAANAWGQAGDTIEVVADGTLYIAYRIRNGVRTEVCRYNDGTGIVPVDSDHRYGGVYLVSGYQSGAPQYGMTIDNFRIKDIDKTAPPTISSLTPAEGSNAGGTPVTISGDFKYGGTPTVKFGNVSATSVVRVNDTTITCVSPATAISTVSVTVTNSNGTSNGMPFEFKLITFTNKSMTKSGSQALGGNGSTNLITGWTGDNTGDGLVMNGSANVTINLSLGFSGGSVDSRIYINGSQVASGSATSASWTGSVNSGDVVEAYAYKSTSFGRNCTSGSMSVTMN